jgi:hypothetical protein
MFEVGQEVSVEFAVPGLDVTLTERHRIVDIDGQTATTVTAFPLTPHDLQHTHQTPLSLIQALPSHGHCGGPLPAHSKPLYALISSGPQGAVADYTTTRYSVQNALRALQDDRPGRVTTWAVHPHQQDASERLDIALRSLLGAPLDKIAALFNGDGSEPYCGRWTGEATTF